MGIPSRRSDTPPSSAARSVDRREVVGRDVVVHHGRSGTSPRPKPPPPPQKRRPGSRQRCRRQARPVHKKHPNRYYFVRAHHLLVLMVPVVFLSSFASSASPSPKNRNAARRRSRGTFRSPDAPSPTSSSSFASFLVLASSSSQPAPSYPSWRDPRYQSPQTASPSQHPYRSRSSYAAAASEDYASHFLDADEWRNDQRSRPYTVNLRSRRPGKLSLTSRIVWLNVLAYAVQALNPNFTNWGIKLSDKIFRAGEWHRLVTPMFLHGGIAHLGTNMYSLNRVGNDVEIIFGPGRYLALYAASGIAGTLASALLSPNPSLGASGAVFGVVGAYFTFLTRNSWLLGPVADSMSSSIAQTMFINVAYGLVNPVIDNWAHLGGALGGAAMAYYFGPRLYVCDNNADDGDQVEGSGGRLLIDRPVLRLPRALESVPENISKRLRRITRRMQIERYKADLPDVPWRPNRRHSHSAPRRYNGDVPNRSIKPRKF